MCSSFWWRQIYSKRWLLSNCFLLTDEHNNLIVFMFLLISNYLSMVETEEDKYIRNRIWRIFHCSLLLCVDMFFIVGTTNIIIFNPEVQKTNCIISLYLNVCVLFKCVCIYRKELTYKKVKLRGQNVWLWKLSPAVRPHWWRNEGFKYAVTSWLL